MATQLMASPQAARIGRFKARLLDHIIPQEVIGRCCKSQKEMVPMNVSDTVVFRRYIPSGTTTAAFNTWNINPEDYQLSEGETPQARTVLAVDVTCTLQQYGIVYRHSDRVSDMYEDDIPDQQVQFTGEGMGLLLEKVRYGVLKAGTNVFRAGGAATRALTNAKISGTAMQNVARSLSANLAKKMTRILAPSQNVGTTSIEAAFIAVCHSDLESDWRALNGFTHISDYGTREAMHENELGSYQQFRVVTSPHLNPYPAAGTTAAADTILTNGAKNTGGAGNADIYPIIIMGEEAYGDVMLRGIGAIKPFHKKPGETSDSDPLGQRGHVGAKTYFTAARLNEFHMAVYEVACSALVG